jgi:superfamily II DNA or RNA helicase
LFGSTLPHYSGASFPTPRFGQAEAHEALRQGARAGHKRQMLMSPTGSGKTYLGMRVAHEALVRDKRVLFLADRRTLINQTSEVADGYGLVAHGVIMANHWRVNEDLPFQIGSVQTLMRREWKDDFHAIIVDEAHTVYDWVAKMLLSTKAHVIGLSATPFSVGLGNYYTNLVNAATMAQLTEAGVLVPMRVLSCTKVNMQGAATSGGEWTDGAAGERGMDIVGDVVSDWKKYAEGRKTIVFGSTIAHCEEMCKQFNEAGVMAQLFTSHTLDTERDQILEEYRKPNSAIRVLISVEALAKGFDVPDVGCVCDVRPLRKSLSTAIQMWGRGLRSSPSTDKRECLLLDFSGNIVRFRDDYAEIFFNGLESLDAGERLDKAIRRDDEEEKAPPKCPQCGFSPMGMRCVACGHERVRLATVEAVAGEMKEIFIGKTKLADDRKHLYEQIATYARSHGNPETAKQRTYYLFKEMSGTDPLGLNFDRTANVPITKAVMNRITARNIAFIRGKQKARATA